MPANNASSSAQQLQGLRQLQANLPVQVIAVTGGKGGIGKTSVSINLAMALSQQHKKILLLDADLGLGNVDIALGLDIHKNLAHVMRGECDLEEIIVKGPGDISIIPSASGIPAMANLTLAEQTGLIHAFSTLTQDVDLLLVDTAAGIHEHVINFAHAAHHVVIVTCNEPASIADSYALIKVLNRERHLHQFRILANMVRDDMEGLELFYKVRRVTDQFLDVQLEYVGAIPSDEYVQKANRLQKPLVLQYPNARATHAFQKIGQQIASWPSPTLTDGHISFFFERLIRVKAATQEALL